MELKGSPAVPLAEDMDESQGLSSPHSEPAKLQTTAVSPHAHAETKPASTGHQGHLEGTNSSPAEHPGSPTLAHDHGPAEMHESSAEFIHIQPSSAQLSPSSSSAISNSTEDQLTATASSCSPVHCSSMPCSDNHSPPSPVELQPVSASQQTPPPDTPCQQSLLLRSPAQVWISQLPRRPTDDCGAPLDQERSGTSSPVLPHCRYTHTVSKLHPDCSPLDGRSTTAIKQGPPKPLSAPCSPSPPQPATKCSVSQPASPVHSQFQLASSQLAVQSGVILKCTSKRSQEELECSSPRTGLADRSLAVESCPASPLSTDDPDDQRPPAGSGRRSLAPVPPNPTPQSLVHSEPARPGCFPPAAEGKAPPPPQSPGGSFAQCSESDDLVHKSSASSSPPQASLMPPLAAASVPACVLTAGPGPPTDGSSAQPSSLLESPVRSPGRPAGSQAGTPQPTYLPDESVAAHPPHPSVEPEQGQQRSSPDSLGPIGIVGMSDAPGDPGHDQEKMVCGSAEDTQTNASPPTSAHPSRGPSPPPTLTSCRPPPCSQGSPLHVENTSKSPPSSAPPTQSSLAQTTADFQSSPHRLAQSSKICWGSHQSPVLNTEKSPGPGSSLNVEASLLMLNSVLPDLVHLEPAPHEPAHVGEMLPEPEASSLYKQPNGSSPSPESAPRTLQPSGTGGQPSAGPSSPPCLSSPEAAPSPRTSNCSSPTQVSSSLPSCSDIPEASARAQALSPHTGTSRPADSNKYSQLQTADTQGRPSPGSSPSEEPPSTGPDSPGLRCAAASRPRGEAERESAAAECEYQEEETGLVERAPHSSLLTLISL